MIIKLTEGDRVVVRAEQDEQGMWTVEGRRDGLLTVRYRIGHSAHVDVFNSCVISLHGLVTGRSGYQQ